MAENQRCVYLIDASIYIFRAYYSVPDNLFNADGQPINALHGFAGFLASFLDEAKPEHLAVVFDESLTTSFRNAIYPEYKANREPPPDELKQQFQTCGTLVQSLGMADFSSASFEADDLIGTLAARMRLLQEHRAAAMLARQLTAISLDSELQVKDSDIACRRVPAADVQDVCARLGLGRMTASRLTRALS